MKHLLLISLLVVCLTACGVSSQQFNDLDQRVAIQAERIVILEEQIRTVNADQLMALNNRINALESRMTPPEPTLVTPVERIPGSILDDDINRLYEEGRRQYESRNFTAAISTFQRVLGLSPSHDLAANAIYWTGESFYALADFTAAREQFQRIQDNYPSSNKFIDAQVKIAMTWLRHDNKPRARTILEAIKRDFPNYERMNVVDQQLRLAR